MVLGNMTIHMTKDALRPSTHTIPKSYFKMSARFKCKRQNNKASQIKQGKLLRD